MKKRILLLAAALCLLCSGCGGGLLEREWSSVTPHSAGYWENGDKDTLRADSYQDAVNAILMLVANHAERGVVRCYFGSDAEYAELAAEACNEVQQETDLGAYLLDYITYAGTDERGFYELSLSFGYRRTAEEQESIINATSTEAIPDLLRAAAAEGADTALLPETWNTGFFPADHLPERSDCGGEAVKALCAPLARELSMNIVAGSVSDRRGGRVYNTAYVFDRQGACLAAYDKTHLFTPMGEHEHYAAGDHLTTFSLDGHKCGLLRPPLPRAFPHAGASGRRAAAPSRAVARRAAVSLGNAHSGARHRKPVLPRRLQLLRHGGRDCVRRRVAHPRSPRRAARRRRSGRRDRHRRPPNFRPCGGPQLHQRLSRPSAGAISSLK